MNHVQARTAGRWRSDQRQFDRRKNDPRVAIPGKRCLPGELQSRCLRSAIFAGLHRIILRTDFERRTYDDRANRRRQGSCRDNRAGDFLRNSGIVVGGVVVAGSLAGSEASAATENADNLPPNVPDWMKTPGDPMGSQLYGMPSSFEKDVIKNIPKNLPQYLSASGRTPLQDHRRHDHAERPVL